MTPNLPLTSINRPSFPTTTQKPLLKSKARPSRNQSSPESLPSLPARQQQQPPGKKRRRILLRPKDLESDDDDGYIAPTKRGSKRTLLSRGKSDERVGSRHNRGGEGLASGLRSRRKIQDRSFKEKEQKQAFSFSAPLAVPGGHLRAQDGTGKRLIGSKSPLGGPVESGMDVDSPVVPAKVERIEHKPKFDFNFGGGTVKRGSSIDFQDLDFHGGEAASDADDEGGGGGPARRLEFDGEPQRTYPRPSQARAQPPSSPEAPGYPANILASPSMTRSRSLPASRTIPDTPTPSSGASSSGALQIGPKRADKLIRRRSSAKAGGSSGPAGTRRASVPIRTDQRAGGSQPRRSGSMGLGAPASQESNRSFGRSSVARMIPEDEAVSLGGAGSGFSLSQSSQTTTTSSSPTSLRQRSSTRSVHFGPEQGSPSPSPLMASLTSRARANEEIYDARGMSSSSSISGLLPKQRLLGQHSGSIPLGGLDHGRITNTAGAASVNIRRTSLPVGSGAGGAVSRERSWRTSTPLSSQDALSSSPIRGSSSNNSHGRYRDENRWPPGGMPVTPRPRLGAFETLSPFEVANEIYSDQDTGQAQAQAPDAMLDEDAFTLDEGLGLLGLHDDEVADDVDAEANSDGSGAGGGLKQIDDSAMQLDSSPYPARTQALAQARVEEETKPAAAPASTTKHPKPRPAKRWLLPPQTTTRRRTSSLEKREAVSDRMEE